MSVVPRRDGCPDPSIEARRHMHWHGVDSNVPPLGQLAVEEPDGTLLLDGQHAAVEDEE
ncbi:hypothetical protein [Micromonospora chersina]|uniref:hypothetical protein n=1 Tax=Micromonospora chersina TaxID=47854 RepID=UPI0037101979